MSDAILKKLFAPPFGTPIDGLVTGKKTAGTWLITDRIGRTMTAISTDTWRPGVDWVTVQDGRIIARSKRRGTIPVYEV